MLSRGVWQKVYTKRHMIDTSVLKARLEKDLQVMTEELQELGIHNPQVTTDWIAIPKDVDVQEADENISADRVEDWEERNATLNALEISYGNITLALSKIENGTYGVCEIGGEEIEEDRLDVEPSARTCKAHMDEEVELLF